MAVNEYERLSNSRFRHTCNTSEMSTFPGHLSSPPVFSGVLVAQYLGCLVCQCLYFSIGHYIVCPSVYSFWLPLWYHQTLPNVKEQRFNCCYSFDIVIIER